MALCRLPGSSACNLLAQGFFSLALVSRPGVGVLPVAGFFGAMQDPLEALNEKLEMEIFDLKQEVSSSNFRLRRSTRIATSSFMPPRNHGLCR